MNVVLGTANPPNLAELVEHLLVEAVHHVRPIQGDGGDMVGANLERHRLIRTLAHCHRLSLGSIKPRSANMVFSISSVPPAMRYPNAPIIHLVQPNVPHCPELTTNSCPRIVAARSPSARRFEETNSLSIARSTPVSSDSGSACTRCCWKRAIRSCE